MLAKKGLFLIICSQKTSQVVNCSCHVGFSFLHVIGIKRHGDLSFLLLSLEKISVLLRLTVTNRKPPGNVSKAHYC